MKTKEEIKKRIDRLRQIRDKFQWESECPNTDRKHLYLSRQHCRNYAHEVQQLILELTWVLH